MARDEKLCISYSDKIIWCTCYWWLILDSINGYFWNNNISLPISQSIKSILLILLTCKLLNQKSVLLFIIITLTVIGINIIGASAYEYPFIGTLQHFSKIVLTVLLFIYFKKCINTWSTYEFEKRAGKVFKIGIIVLLANVFIGIFGIGYHTYTTEQYGYKGFFASGNEMGGLVVTLIPVFLYWAYFSLSKIKYCICTIICIIFGILLSTKSVIVIVIIFCIYIPYSYNTNKSEKRKILILGLCILAVGIYILLSHIDLDSITFIVQLSYRYSKGGLIYILLSARNEFVIEQFEIFQHAPLYQRIFGMGSKQGNLDTVEMDYFDILFYYGYFGLIIILALTIYLFLIIKRNYFNNNFNKVILTSDILTFIMAAFAGHIFFSSTAGLYIALINSFLYSKKKYPLIRNKHNVKISSHL